VRISEGTATDLPGVVAMALPVIAELGETPDRVRLRDSILPYEALAGHLWLVARDEDGRVLGSLLAQARQDPLSGRHDVFVDAIAVGAEHRGNGVGAALLAVAEGWGIRRGAAGSCLGIPLSSPMAVPEGYCHQETWYRKELSP